MLVNLNDIYQEIYKNIKYTTNAEIDFDAFLHTQNYIAKDLNIKFNKSRSWNQLYVGDKEDFALQNIVSSIEINNYSGTITITSADITTAAVLSKLNNAEDNSMAIFNFIPSVYSVDRLYFKADGAITFLDKIGFDDLQKNFSSDKGVSGYEYIDGSGSTLDKIWSTIYFRNNGSFAEDRAKAYKDTGGMTYGGNFAFINSKLYIPKEILSKYIGSDSIPNYELSGYMCRGIDVYTGTTSYALAGSSIFIPDYLYMLYSSMIELFLRQAKGVEFDTIKEKTNEYYYIAKNNEADQINLVDTRKVGLWD